MRLSLASVSGVPQAVRRPSYDVAGLKHGMVHLGLGAFHRAHQAVFTEEAIERTGGDWGIIGVSMRRPDVADSLAPQDGLYTVEQLAAQPDYRIIGAVRRTLVLPLQPQAVIAALADPGIHVITLTITEKGYGLSGDDLDLAHPDIAHDLAGGTPPRSAIAVLASGLLQRRWGRAGPVTVISCDNLSDNGRRLETAVHQFAERAAPGLGPWLDANTTFPETMVDCIVPAADDVSRRRVESAIGLEDRASVLREPFAEWVIEDRFAGPSPAWPGVARVEWVQDFRRLKLHVLNAAHSALAYLGRRRGHTFVREAIADAELAARLEAMILTEVAPALPDLPVLAYWRTARERFANALIDHRLDQIAQDGEKKLAERLYPLMRANLQAGRSVAGMAEVVRAWLDATNPRGCVSERLANPQLFPDAFRAEPRMAAAVTQARP